MSPLAPVGVFDSGMGGLSVAREIRARLPHEEIVYLADSAYCPYGDRTVEEIRERTLACVGELVSRGAKTVVVACNTASGAALEELRATYGVPIVGVEPAVKPAAESTRRGSIGVLATVATLQTERFGRLVDRYAGHLEVAAVGCPGLAEMVESGTTEGAEVRARLEDLAAPIREAEADVVVLGCTHYPFLRPELEAVLGPEVRIIDSGAAVARQVERVLSEEGGLAVRGPGGFHLLTTGDADEVRPVAERLLGRSVPVESVDV